MIGDGWCCVCGKSMWGGATRTVPPRQVSRLRQFDLFRVVACQGNGTNVVAVLTEAERVEAAFYELLANDPDAAPSMGKITKIMGVRNVNGRIVKKRQELLAQHWFAKDGNRYVRTRQWCPGCGQAILYVDGFCGDAECAIVIQ